MKWMVVKKRAVVLLSALVIGCIVTGTAQARDVRYSGDEISVRVNPNEPTQLQFQGKIAGGFKKKNSSVALDKKDSDLVIFANEGITDAGEAVIIRLDDGRSYSIRVQRATQEHPRDSFVHIDDDRASLMVSKDEEEPAYKEKRFEYAPPTKVSGLMREMMLVAEFGKQTIPGYRVSEQYKGQTVLEDGTMKATIEKVFLGPDLWGYVLKTENLLNEGQKINPATFRLDGTRAIGAKEWELAARPLTAEQQLSGKHMTNVYIITKAKK